MEYLYERRLARRLRNSGVLLLISGQNVMCYDSVADDLFVDDLSINAGVRLCIVSNIKLYYIGEQDILTISCFDKDNLDKLFIRYCISDHDASALGCLMSAYGEGSTRVTKFISKNILSCYDPVVINETTASLNTEHNIIENMVYK
jgi:hypothetical protein